MRQFHPGLHAFLELYVDDVEEFLSETYEPIASHEVRALIAFQLLDGSGKTGSINWAQLDPVGSA